MDGNIAIGVQVLSTFTAYERGLAHRSFRAQSSARLRDGFVREI